MKHSIFSASAAHRWVACPGSIALSQGIEDRGSPAAAEGTMLHNVMDWCLTNDKDATDWTQDLLNDEQEDVVQECLDYVRSIPAAGRFYEMQVTYGRLIGQDDELAFGTLDVALLDKRHLHVLDAKFGRRFVGAEGNQQMLLYAIGVVDALAVLGDEVDTISMHIMQPRINGWSRAEPWTIKRSDLDAHIETFKAQSKKALEALEHTTPEVKSWQDAYLDPTPEGCLWCKAKLVCPSFTDIADDAAEQVEAASLGDFDVVVKEVDLSAAMQNIPFLEMYINAVTDEVMSRLSSGGEVKGYKLVQGRAGNRNWAEEGEDLVKTLNAMGIADPFAEPKVISPAAAEKKLTDAIAQSTGMKKKDAKEAAQDHINPLVVRSAPKPTVVTEDHPGKPWTAAATLADFD